MEKNGSKHVSRNGKNGQIDAKVCAPRIVSLLVGALYNIVDQIFIANADYLGSFRQCGKLRGVPDDGNCLGDSNDDRRLGFAVRSTSINLGAKDPRKRKKASETPYFCLFRRELYFAAIYLISRIRY